MNKFIPYLQFDFNPRSREGSDRLRITSIWLYSISIHAPARGATISVHDPTAVCGFQSTLPRGERLTFVSFLYFMVHISIHAPARGATIFCLPLIPSMPISIHAPARGATRLNNILIAYMEFQSTLPRGERPQKAVLKAVEYIFQSTLPRGERQELRTEFQFLHTISIHAPARGATKQKKHPALFRNISIHAPARGATMFRQAGSDPRNNFNPRSREGSDYSLALPPFRFQISIHAPARGATEEDSKTDADPNISIHAPARGATYLYQIKKRFLQFQSTLPRGERLQITRFRFPLFLISIHAPARGATITRSSNICMV